MGTITDPAFIRNTIREVIYAINLAGWELRNVGEGILMPEEIKFSFQIRSDDTTETTNTETEETTNRGETTTVSDTTDTEPATTETETSTRTDGGSVSVRTQDSSSVSTTSNSGADNSRTQYTYES